MSSRIISPGAVVSSADAAPSPNYRFFIPGAEPFDATFARDKTGNGRIATPPALTISDQQRSTAYALNALVRRVPSDGFVYRCTVAGTTAASEPTANYNAASENTGAVVDGTASFVKIGYWTGFPGALSCGIGSTFDSGFSLSPGAPGYNVGAGDSFIVHFQTMLVNNLLTGSGASTFFGDRYDGANPGMRFTICRGGGFVPGGQNRFGFSVQSRSGGDGSGATVFLNLDDSVSGIEGTPQIVVNTWHTILLAIDGQSKLVWFAVDGTFSPVANGAASVNGINVSSLTNTLAVLGIHAGAAPNTNSTIGQRFRNIGCLRFPGAGLPANFGVLAARLFSDPHIPLLRSEVR